MGRWLTMRWMVLVAALSLASLTSVAAEFPKFEAKTLDPDVGKVCYAVTLADVDGDGKQDIVAVTENRVLWYQAPDWKRRVIIDEQTERDNVCIAPLDIDGDGQIDFAVGAGWSGKNTGQLVWLSRGAALDEKWHVHLIGHEPWTHRMRFGNVAGGKRPQMSFRRSPKRRETACGCWPSRFPKIPRPIRGQVRCSTRR